MPNTFLEKIEYKIEVTAMGTWMRYGYENGTSFHEFRSHLKWLGFPFIHYTYGRSPETGKRVTAKGVFAVGRIACGVFAIGQLSVGVISIGQLAIGILFGLGQLSTGLAAVGQAAIALYFSFGQFAIGQIAIGQFAYGQYVLAQMGFGENVLSLARRDELALEFFKKFPVVKNFLH
jgi:hypothetical protein